MNRIRIVLVALVAVALLGISAPELLARTQGMPQTGLASQSLRPYWHVFIAYTIAIALVLGWVISIGRRLRDVEDRLGQG